tara:strand:+ start:6813 stop:7820 length:1008 start_codon:yes stop_codon:yes gene_type:complete
MKNLNKFYIDNLTDIVFIGFSEVFENLIKINNELEINTSIISSTNQSKAIDFEHKVFDKIDKQFYNYVDKNFNISNTLFISVGSRIIFNSESIKFFQGNLINSHAARLPYDAGGGAFSWRIMREDRIDNQLFHKITEDIDDGPIIISNTSIIPSNCKKPKDFEEYSLNKFQSFYKNFITRLKKGEKYSLKEQTKYLGNYNPRLSTNDHGYIDWNINSYDLFNFINSFDDPYPGAMTFLDRGKFGVLRIKSVHLHGGEPSNHPFMSGIVKRHDKDWLVVASSGKHSILVEEVIDENGENIIDQIRQGDRFYTPNNYLDHAKKTKVKFTSKGKKYDK